jgi:hypothetical protein
MSVPSSCAGAWLGDAWRFAALMTVTSGPLREVRPERGLLAAGSGSSWVSIRWLSAGRRATLSTLRTELRWQRRPMDLELS